MKETVAILEPVHKCTNDEVSIEDVSNMITVHGLEVIVDGKSKRLNGTMKFCNIYCLNTFLYRMGNGDD